MTTVPNTKHEFYDLVVIGGGINGAAIARDASLRGLKVVLLEKNDFGSGASTKTSKLAHGGVRYLEQFQFSLVRESLKERSLLLKNASHLVKPLPFLLPVYSGDPRPLWQVHLGLFLYDYLAGKGDLPSHRKLDAEAVLKQVSGLKSQGLNGGCSYYDAQMLDNRIVIENILSAKKAGARVYNHTEVVGLIREEEKIVGVDFIDTMTNVAGSFFGKVVVNATGAWSAQIGGLEPNAEHCLPAPTKGVHFIVPKIVDGKALLLRAPQDGRVFFVLPWEQFSLVGTTDTFFDGDPDQLAIERDDSSYLLEALNSFFPDHPLTESSIIASFVGLRPLVMPDKKNPPSDIVREHVIQISKGGLVTILGGKYTTHRLVAEEVVDTVIKELKTEKPYASCVTANQPLPGASGPYSLAEVKEQLKVAGLNTPLVDHLLNTYGTASLIILQMMTNDPHEAETICPSHPHVFAELTYGVNVEHVKTLEDWFARRTTIAYTPCNGVDCMDRVAEKLATLLGWTNDQTSHQKELYKASIPKICHPSSTLYALKT